MAAGCPTVAKQLSDAGQKQVAQQFCDGLTVSRIASAMGMSRESVEKELVRQRLLTINPDGTRSRDGWRTIMRDRELTAERARNAGLYLP